MKLTKARLKRIIQEELKNVLMNENPQVPAASAAARGGQKWISQNWSALCKAGYMASGQQLIKIWDATGQGKASAEEMIARARDGEDVGLVKMSLRQRANVRCPE